MSLYVKFQDRRVLGRHPLVCLRDDWVFVADADDGGRSITNDAEAVVAELLEEFGPARHIIYRDTEGRWDELDHDGLKFTRFKKYEGWTP